MLINCPECGHQISDQAYACPYCGMPMQQRSSAPARSTPPVRQKKLVLDRLPNGYGTIRKLSGRRTRPYAAFVNPRRVVNDENRKSHYHYDLLGTYSSRTLAMEAILDYRRNSYNIAESKLTFSEVYKRWSEMYFNQPKIAANTVNSYKTAYRNSSALYGTVFRDIRKPDMQRILDDGRGRSSAIQLTTLWHQMYIYAREYEICTKDYTEFLETSHIETTTPHEHRRLTPDEVKALFDYAEKGLFPSVYAMLIGTGCRINELLTLKREDVHLSEGYIEIVSSKTKAGKRAIPIHPRIRKYIEAWMNDESGSKYLIHGNRNNHVGYSNFKDNYMARCKALLGIDFKPHDCRYTLASLMKQCEVDEFARKKILGHAIPTIDVTNAVYTEMPLSWFAAEMAKVNFFYR